MPQQTDLEPKRLPLVVVPSNRDDNTDKDAKLVNGYVEKDEYGNYHIYKRPGLGTNTTLGGGAGAGLYNWLGDIYAVVGATLYKNGVSIGTVDSTGGVYKFSSVLGAVPKLVLGNGVYGYYWDGTTLTRMQNANDVVTAGSFVVGFNYTILVVGTTDFTLIGASANTIGVAFVATGVGTGTGTANPINFPVATQKGWAYLDGTLYVLTPKAFIDGSGINNPALWDPLNSILAQIEPDQGVALDKQLVYVIALKQWSTEVFYDAGNATGSPLGPVQGAKVSYGCGHQDSVQNIDDVLLWLAVNRSGSAAIIAMDMLKSEIVSTKPVERLLDDMIVATGILSWQHKDEGHTFYGFTSKSLNITLVYDLREKLWSEWTDVNGNYLPIVASCFTSAQEHLVQLENGSIYTLDSEFTVDAWPAANSPITTDIYAPNFDEGNRFKKTMMGMRFIADQTPGSVLQVRVNDNDFDPTKWSNFRTVDLGQKSPYLKDWGTFRRRAHHFRHSSPTRLRIQAVEYNLLQGSM